MARTPSPIWAIFQYPLGRFISKDVGATIYAVSPDIAFNAITDDAIKSHIETTLRTHPNSGMSRSFTTPDMSRRSYNSNKLPTDTLQLNTFANITEVYGYNHTHRTFWEIFDPAVDMMYDYYSDLEVKSDTVNRYTDNSWPRKSNKVVTEYRKTLRYTFCSTMLLKQQSDFYRWIYNYSSHYISSVLPYTFIKSLDPDTTKLFETYLLDNIGVKYPKLVEGFIKKYKLYQQYYDILFMNEIHATLFNKHDLIGNGKLLKFSDKEFEFVNVADQLTSEDKKFEGFIDLSLP